jgi:hypothetical protein
MLVLCSRSALRMGSVATEAFGTSIASGQRWPESGHPRSILKCRDGGQLRTRRSSSNNLCRRSASRLTLSRQPRMIVSTATSPQDKRPRWLLKCLPDCDWQRGSTVSWTITGDAIANLSANRINIITDRPNICSRYWRSSRRVAKMSVRRGTADAVRHLDSSQTFRRMMCAPRL